MTVNEWLQLEAIRHALDFRFYTNSIVYRMVAVLNRADSRLFAELASAIDRLDQTSFTVDRLDSMIGSVRALNVTAFQQVGRDLDSILLDFVAYELAYQRQLMVAAMPIQVSVASVSAEAVYAAAMARPFQGVLMREVWPDLAAARMKTIRQTVAQGFVEGKTTDIVVRELRGTKAKGYADGLVNKARRDVEAVVRTGMGHYSGFVADRAAEANSDLIKAVRWESTLDLRTTPFCRLRDGKRYTPGDHKPIGHTLSWGGGPGRAHWNCRSHQSFITKSWREMGVDMDEVPEGTRASMDGQVPADLTYNDWLAKQSASRQDDVLGPARGKLYRDGKLPMDRMYDSKGKTLTLEQMRARDAQAFKMAGV